MASHARSIDRLLDANSNRAAEGLRLLEDIARFRLDDAGLTERAKLLRHVVRGACPAGAVRSRAAADDVGREITTDAEGVRASAEGIAAAAAKRAQEALRVLEECAKLNGRDWRALEAARYQTYELEADVMARLAELATPRSQQWRLCVLVTESLCSLAWEGVVARALAGGADCIQLREKSLSDRVLLKRARRLVALCAEHDACAVINDRADIAAMADAHGVHVGQGDVGPGDARGVVGEGVSVGVSTARLDEATLAIARGADMCGLGPVFPSSTKPKERIAGPEYVRAYLRDERTRETPHLAISGVTGDRAAELAAIGCRGVAVSGAVCASGDPEGAASEIVEAMRRGAVDSVHGNDLPAPRS
ncbi:MAG: thiamine phosphate synthase [Planctomycetota bacterium]